MRPALGLGVGLIAIAAVPTVAAMLVLGDAEGDPQPDGPVAAISAEGAVVSVDPPADWLVSQQGSMVMYQSGDARVFIEVYDRGGRDVDRVTERLMRLDRLRGISSALDGGTISSGDGELAGATCVLTAPGAVGRCAALADDDVVVFVQTVGTAGDPPLGLDEVAASLSRSDPS